MTEITRISLGEFERRYGVNKGTVHKRAQSMGLSTSGGLDSDAVEALKEAFNVSDADDGDATQQSEATSIQIHTGNHVTVLDAPAFSTEFDLGDFRGSDSTEMDDPLAAAERFLEIGDQLIGAMDQDAEAREAKLRKTREARDKIASKKQEILLEQRLYKERTRASGNALQAETLALQDDLAHLNGMGKRPDTGASGQS